MKNKLKYLIGVSLKRKVKTKWFAITNIILALVIVAVCNIDRIITFFGGDFNDITKIYVLDETKDSYDYFKTYFENGFSITGETNEKYDIILSDKTQEELTEIIKTDEKEKNSILLIFKDDETNVINVTMATNDFSNLSDLSLITTAINQTKMVLAIEKYNLTEQQVADLTTGVELNRIVLNENKDSTEENMNMIMTTVFPIIILPFFILSIFLVQTIGAEVNDEKTTRGMEIIISSVSPKVHFFAKCIAGNAFILLQGLLLMAYVGLGIVARVFLGGGSLGVSSSITGELSSLLGSVFTSDFIASLSYLIPLILILMVITFVAYSLIAGILASMTTNAEDFQQIQTPIMIINLIGYYLAIMAGAFQGALFIKILGYVPFISAILSPSLLVMGEFTIIDVIISIGIMIVFVFLLIKYGLRIYKVGILNYSSNGLWKKMAKALKSK